MVNWHEPFVHDKAAPHAIFEEVNGSPVVHLRSAFLHTVNIDVDSDVRVSVHQSVVGILLDPTMQELRDLGSMHDPQ